MSLLMETTAVHIPRATPKSVHAALLLFSPIFTCVASYVTWGECIRTHTLYSKIHTHRAAQHTTLKLYRRDPICLVGTVVLRGVVRWLDICWPLLFFLCWLPHWCLFVSWLCAEFCLGGSAKREGEIENGIIFLVLLFCCCCLEHNVSTIYTGRHTKSLVESVN